MKTTKLIRLPLITKSLTALYLLVAPLMAHGIESIVSDPTGVTIDFTPEFLPEIVDNEGNLAMSVSGGAVALSPGLAKQPLRFVTLAVPPGSAPTARVVSWEAGENVSGKFAIHQVDPADEAIATVANLQTDGKLDVHSLLGLATVRVPIYPTRQVGSSTIIKASRVVVRVDFHAPRYSASVEPVKINRLHRLLIPNLDEAEKWGKFRTSNFTLEGWPQGYLYRFEVEEEGIFRLNFEDLVSNGVTLASNGVPADQIRIFGNGGLELPLSPEAPAPVGLTECAIYVNAGNDGRFGPGDWLLFYGRVAGGYVVGSDGVTRFSLNRYTTRNNYWLNIDPAGGGKRMAAIADTPSSIPKSRVLCNTHFEPEKFIYGGTAFMGAGRDWYGYTFDGPSRISYNAVLPSADPSVAAVLKLRIVKAFGGLDPSIKVMVNGITIDSTLRPEYYYTDAVKSLTIPAGILHPGSNNVSMEQTRSGAADALFDWFDFTYTAGLNATLTFGNIDTSNAPVTFVSTLNNPWLFDITDHDSVSFAQIDVNNTGINSFRRRFISTQMSDFRRLTPRFQSYFPPEEDIPDLFSRSNAADILLIVPDNFYEAVEPLYNHYARRDPPLNAARIRLSEVYNRFSGGLRDPGAIRNLLHYAKDNWATVPQFVVFCGDGDYNYRDIDRQANPDFMPPYEAGYDKTVLCSDDWFVDFTATGRDLLAEMAHGRLTARKPWELEAMVKKIVRYEDEPEWGLWRNRITLAADDESSETSNFEYMHVEFSEQLARNILPGFIDKVKVYETEFARQLGREKPAATDALLSSINNGTLIVNYMGHGNPTLWAHERLFVLSRDFNRIEPSVTLPLFIAFTCDWAYWDDPSAQSFPEQLLADEDGGAIAAIASTRLTYSPPNETLSENFYRSLFSDDEPSVGEALWRSKRDGWSSTSPTYHLLGDPAMRLAIPRRRGHLQALTPSPLPPLGKVTVNGDVLLYGGGTDNQFEGEVLFSLRDSAIPREYVIGEDESAITLHYQMPGAIAFRGFMSIENGRFNGEFIVPRDVTLGGENGRATAYFYNEETDGIALIDTIRFANRTVAGIDTMPPEIKLFFDHRSYREGDEVGPEPLVILELADSSGVNLTSAMGHGIWLTVGNSKPVNLTKTFRYNLDSHQEGSLEQQIGPFVPGKYPVKVEVWDSFNNLSVLESEIEVVDAAGGLVIDRVLNWPNPFNDMTSLTFSINRAATYEIKVFTVGGRLIRNYTGRAPSSGLVSNVHWDGRDHTGARVGNGVYLYKVVAWDDENARAEGLGRIAFIR